jgi:hypothetical protein
MLRFRRVARPLDAVEDEFLRNVMMAAKRAEIRRAVDLYSGPASSQGLPPWAEKSE